MFGVTHSFSAGMDLREQRVYFVQGRVRLNRWRCQIEIDSGWKHVCFGFSAWDSVVVCFGFSGHMRGRTNGSTRYHGCRGNDLFEQKLSRDSLRRKSS